MVLVLVLDTEAKARAGAGTGMERLLLSDEGDTERATVHASSSEFSN